MSLCGRFAARSEHVDALYAVLTDGMQQRTTAEWLTILALVLVTP